MTTQNQVLGLAILKIILRRRMRRKRGGGEE
jgi:hypothetical protein